jgi:phosphoribosylamine-glycine ligase
LQRAVQRAYEGCAKINFDGAYYRKDIAARALKK